MPPASGCYYCDMMTADVSTTEQRLDTPTVGVELMRPTTATVPVARRTAAKRVATEPEANATEKIPAAELVPAHLLDGGEIVLFAIKPSLWMILFASVRWILVLSVVIAASRWLESVIPGAERMIIIKASLALMLARVGFATMEWVSRLYVLTNRRVMRIRGIFNVNLFECALPRIQNTFLTLRWYERITRLGTISFATAGTGGIEASWVNVNNPIEIHEQLRAAINRSRGASNGL
jgi:uncharacterized membrane protein YdbT with pleckstrin-like domain